MGKKQTPMMEQYFSIKARYEKELLFFRLGDFYELFYDDAITASRELNITLTGRNAGEEDKAPMCGVPFHSAESYIEKLISKGYKVAICEQVEDPKEAKGIVRRDVIRVITPGTVLSENGTKDGENNFLALTYETKGQRIVLFADITTGEVIWERMDCGSESSLFDAFTMYQPKELILAGNCELPTSIQDFLTRQMSGIALSPFTPTETIDSIRLKGREHFSDAGLLEEDVLEALGYVILYLEDVIKTDTSHINYVHQLSVGDRMILDTSCLRHLEITRNVRDGSKKGTLLDVLDKTLTPMGARMLKQWIEHPLMDIHRIVRRQMGIGESIDNPTMRSQLRSLLTSVYDFERILSRVETGSVSPRDFASLRESLRVLPMIQEVLQHCTSNILQDCHSMIHIHDDLCDLLTRAIVDQPSLALKDGHVIRDGYSPELDELRSLATNSQEWLHRLEEEAKQATGIRLKTGYNKVFGYYFEVSQGQVGLVPDYFIRKQTLTNAERYITPELKEFEIKMLNAKEQIQKLEYSLYQDLRLIAKENIKDIQETARGIAQLDVILSLGEVAFSNKYICPTIVTNGAISIKDGRHPVIETLLKQELFIPNDVVLNHSEEEFILITGPNMAGKSTYMRQVALLMIMAQIGSFIPAREATIAPVDRIFTRVGASDDISTGQSTFMVEMKEVSYILEHATCNSLVILDEIGRGTSTFDGLSIARAVVEHICETIHCKSLFATHYHELIELEEQYSKLKNYTVAVKDKGNDVLFLRRIVKGGADRSYGIHVAKLAGLPKVVLDRANTILSHLEDGKVVTEPMPKKKEKQSVTGPLFGSGDLFTQPVLDQLLKLDIMSMTPIEAISELYRLQEEAKQGGGK